MMIRVGTTKAVWVVFVLALIIIGLAGWAAIIGSSIMQALFILAGIAISIVQGSVAYCNWTGRDNVITKQVRILHSSLLRIISR
jgi:predicted membrane chloride channel (bestrophin family)